MFKTKKIFAILITIMLCLGIGAVMLLSACDGETPDNPEDNIKDNIIDSPTDNLSLATIESVSGGELSGFGVSFEIANTSDAIDVSELIEVSSGASWQVYSDSDCSVLVSSGNVTELVDGDNIYYILVSSGDGEVNTKYTLTVYKKYYVEIAYISEGMVYKTENILTHSVLGEGPEITREGYTFKGWGSNGHYVTEAKAFTASWKANDYTVTLNANGGEISSDSLVVTMGSSFSIPLASGNVGHSFDGWYTKETDGTKITNANGVGLTNWNIASDVVLYAVWTPNTYQVYLEKNIAEAGSVVGFGEKTYNTSVTITAETNVGYTWVGWYDGSEQVSTNTELTYVFNMPANNKTYKATWQPITSEVSFNVNGGNSTHGAVEITTGDSIAESKAFPKPGHSDANMEFMGWYTAQVGGEKITDKNGNGLHIWNADGLSTSEKYWACDDVETTLYARWKDTSVQFGYQRVDSNNTPKSNGTHVLFGEWPQTIKAGDIKITTIQDERGYYLGSDDCYYAKVIAAPNKSGYRFSNNETIHSGSIYFFKVELIKWRILISEEGNKALLLYCT